MNRWLDADGILQTSMDENTGSIKVLGPVTDTQLRATPVPVSGTVSTGLSQPLTDTQLRASAVPVSFGTAFNSQLQTTDFLNGTASQASLVVGTSAVAARVGGSNLTNRKLLVVQAQADGYTYGFDATDQFFSLPNGATVSFAVGPNITIYIKKASGSANVIIAEVS